MREELITSIFKITSSTPYNDNHKFYRLECSSWVNVIAITKKQEVVLVKQYRYGIDQDTIEFPAGQVDITDSKFLEAAKRELQEETGYGKGIWSKLGWVHPNTAIQNNRCYNFLAKDVEVVSPINNDLHEKTEVLLVDIKKVIHLILEHKITHSLAINAFFFYCIDSKLLRV